MTWLKVEGQNTLSGSIVIQGSKNAALPIMAAAIMNNGTTILKNVPDIKDVECMRSILEYIGCRTDFNDGVLTINAEKINNSILPVCECKSMRSSIILLGPMLSRMKKVTAYKPGGCFIGKRPIDIHIYGLSKLGVIIDEQKEQITASGKALKGCDIVMSYPSVGATENIIMAAACADGETRLHNYAREPEVHELCRFLRCLGVGIEGFGGECLSVTGGIKSGKAEYSICGDRIVTGTYMCACLMCGGHIFLEGAPVEQLGFLSKSLDEMGAKIWTEKNGIGIESTGYYRAIPYLKTEPYPGFSTDLQSQMLCALSLADGVSEIEETVFENRFHIVKELQKMGAEIIIKRNAVMVSGVKKLNGAVLQAMDLRGGAALVLAGLAAEGVTEIHEASHIHRGYEKLERNLTLLGGKITCME